MHRGPSMVQCTKSQLLLCNRNCRVKKRYFFISSCRNAPFNERNKTSRGFLHWVKTDGDFYFWTIQFGQNLLSLTNTTIYGSAYVQIRLICHTLTYRTDLLCNHNDPESCYSAFFVHISWIGVHSNFSRIIFYFRLDRGQFGRCADLAMFKWTAP